MELLKWIQRVSLPDETAMAAARKRQAQLAKLPGSLGRLEELSIQLAGITGRVHNRMEKKHLLVFAADNGVAEEGVSSAPQSVTLMQTINLTRHKTGASTLCRHFGCEITVCDVGVNADIREEKVLNRKIAYGTNNIVKGPAMTKEQAIQANIPVTSYYNGNVIFAKNGHKKSSKSFQTYCLCAAVMGIGYSIF